MQNLSCYDSMMSYARKIVIPTWSKQHGANDRNIARMQQNRHKKESLLSQAWQTSNVHSIYSTQTMG